MTDLGLNHRGTVRLPSPVVSVAFPLHTISPQNGMNHTILRAKLYEGQRFTTFTLWLPVVTTYTPLFQA